MGFIELRIYTDLILKRFDFQSLKMPLFVKSIFEQMKCPTCQSMNQPWSHMMMQNLKCLEVLGWKPLFDHKIQEIEHRLSNMEKTVAKHAKFLHFLCKKKPSSKSGGSEMSSKVSVNWEKTIMEIYASESSWEDQFSQFLKGPATQSCYRVSQ